MYEGIYIFPSVITLGNIIAGFFSIISTLNGNFSQAAWAILVAMCMDILDGRIARIMNSTSKFGIEFDSLADIISFGIAPAALMYEFVLSEHGRGGAMVAFLFVITGVLRLARYNVKAHEGESTDFFIGLPIPAAAGILASFVIVYGMFVQEITRRTIPLLMKRMPFLFNSIPVIMIILSFLMVSNIRYSNFRKFRLSKRIPFRILMFIVIPGLIFLAYPENTILIIFMLYILSGIIGVLWRSYKLRRLIKKPEV